MASPKVKKIIIVGAGVAGREAYRAIARKTSVYRFVGFVDDALASIKIGSSRLQVLGPVEDIPRIVRLRRIDQILVAIPSAEGRLIRKIITACNTAKVSFRIIPRTLEIIEGRVGFSHIRDLQPEDLIGRAIKKTDQGPLREFIYQKRVLVTGAAGSIGSEICRQVAEFKPSRLIILDWWENGLYDLEMELREHYPGVNLPVEIANIQDVPTIQEIMARHRPDIVFHAAAYKHVPMMERAPHEAVKNNVLGTWSVATSAKSAGVKKFILISSDKAVNPTNVMGATKRLAELLTDSLNSPGRTKFTAVRFGNVFASRGSVVPLFQQQIAKGGPVTVTHPNMVRYFMSIPEAVQLVLQASNAGRGHEIFVLDMGEPVKIIDLARNMIRLSGFEPDRDIAIEFTGARPGEKIIEEMLTSQEGTTATKIQNIFVATNEVGVRIKTSTVLKQLNRVLRTGTAADVKSYLGRVITTYRPAHD